MIAPKQFLKDKRGNFAIIAAVASIPLLGAISLSVDITEWLRQKEATQNALDTTAIATAKHFLSGASEESTKTYSEAFFRANIAHANTDETAFTIEIPTVESPRDDVVLTAVLNYKPAFLPAFRSLLGLPHDQFDFVTTVQVKVQNTMEVALVLDNSGSMDYTATGSSQKRIALLKKAAKQLVTQLGNRAAMMKKVIEPVRIGVVPFAASVNVGSQYSTAAWMDIYGKSPVHHENFDWPVVISVTKQIGWLNGHVRKLGIGWPLAEQGQIFTRFTLYDSLLRYTRRNSNTTTSAAQWMGCVEARPYPYNVNGADASQGDPASLYVPMFSPDEHDPISRRNSSTRTSDNSWWEDSVGAGDTDTARTAQRNMLKYFTPAAYNSSTASGYDIGPNNTCSTIPLLPLTDISTAAGTKVVTDKIDAMQSLGGTNVPEGMTWGWNLVSSGAPFTEGRPEIENGNDKVVIVLTDGQNTYYPANGSDLANNRSGYSSYGYVGQNYNGGSRPRLFMNTTSANTSVDSIDNYGKALDDHFKNLCAAAKAKKVIVMTVGLDLKETDVAEKRQIELLRGCASESRFRREPDGTPSKLFWNSTGKTLDDDFKALGEELSNLRIVG